MKVRPYEPSDKLSVIKLIAEFRVGVAKLKGHVREPDIESAKKELEEYIQIEYPIFVAEFQEELVGYIICRTDGDVVWAEQLYVKQNARRKGIASTLFLRAEQLANTLGNETLYNWIHPNNNAIILFLRKHGYNVLNLIEVRKPWNGESTVQKIKVGKNDFDY